MTQLFRPHIDRIEWFFRCELFYSKLTWTPASPENPFFISADRNYHVCLLWLSPLIKTYHTDGSPVKPKPTGFVSFVESIDLLSLFCYIGSLIGALSSDPFAWYHISCLHWQFLRVCIILTDQYVGIHNDILSTRVLKKIQILNNYWTQWMHR